MRVPGRRPGDGQGPIHAQLDHPARFEPAKLRWQSTYQSLQEYLARTTIESRLQAPTPASADLGSPAGTDT